MRILYFHQYFSTFEGCWSTRSFEFAKTLVNSGHEVTMVCLKNKLSNSGLKNKFKKGKRVGIVNGIKVIELNISYSNHLGFIKRSLVFSIYSFKSVLIALTHKADLIYATSTPLTSGLPGIFARFLKGTTFIFEVRDLWPELPQKMGIIKNPFILNLLYKLEKLTYLSSDLIIGLAPGICKGIEKRNISSEKIKFIPNFCNTSDFSETSLSKKQNTSFKKFLKILHSQESFIAAFTGAHGKTNGLYKLINVALELEKLNRTDITIFLIGDGKEKPFLKKEVKRLSIKNIIFLDPLKKNILFQFMNEYVDAGLMLLDDVEGFFETTSPNKFFDYISLGLPIIINYPGWIARLVVNENIGIEVPPNDYKSFAKALIKLADKKSCTSIMSKNSESLALEKFSNKKMGNELIKAIDLAKKNSRSRKNYFDYLIKLAYKLFKSLIDRTVALILLILTFPLLILVALLSKLLMGSPVIFKQKRPGLKSKIFEIWKFRTLLHKIDQKGQLLPDSKRTCLFGSILRRTSIDELPQLINIIKGEMSFIGPRPLLTDYLDLYTYDQNRRHEVMPGITGWAQVNGRNSSSWEERFNLDLWYVDNINFLIDLRIILLTFIKLIKFSDIGDKKNSTFKGNFKGNPNINK